MHKIEPDLLRNLLGGALAQMLRPGSKIGVGIFLHDLQKQMACSGPLPREARHAGDDAIHRRFGMLFERHWSCSFSNSCLNSSKAARTMSGPRSSSATRYIARRSW